MNVIKSSVGQRRCFVGQKRRRLLGGKVGEPKSFRYRGRKYNIRFPESVDIEGLAEEAGTSFSGLMTGLIEYRKHLLRNGLEMPGDSILWKLASGIH